MKKIQFVLLTAGLVALAAACEKQPAASEPEAGERVTTISASIEGSGTKVTIADADGKFSWSAGDKIIVHTSGGYVLSDALTAGGTTANFEFTNYTLYDDSRDFFAVYPGDYATVDGVNYGDAVLKINYPSVYKITSLSNTNYAPVPMIAANAPGGTLNFRHIGALIRVTVKDVPPTTKSLNVVFEKKVTGPFIVDLADPSNPYVKTEDGYITNTTITFDLPSELTTMRDVVLNIPVPTGNVGAFYVEAYNEGDLLMRTRQTSGVIMARKQGRKAMASLPVFTTLSGTKVVFSPGNLQASTTDGGSHWEWAFAAHQYDIVGNAAGNNSIGGNGLLLDSTPNGTVDLFGWSTADTYFGIHQSTDSINDYEGDFVDWGLNQIGPYAADTWRTLGFTEWNALLVSRTASTVGATENARYVKATVAEKAGVILFPDQYKHPDGVTVPPNINDKSKPFTNIVYNTDDWEKMELAGCIFLPAAGYRAATTLTNVGSECDYWTNAKYLEKNAYRVSFTATGLTLNYYNRHFGRSVRLARNVNY